jgi:HEAT repeat protein
MTLGVSLRTTFWMSLAVLLAVPAATQARRYAASQQAPVEEPQEAYRADQNQEARDREQEKRDREQEKLDREQEQRDREQERADRMEELYDDGRAALEEDRFEQAAAKFKQLEAMNGAQADAALYWKAYAENRLGKRDVALATLASLKQRFPQSRWQKDAGALEIEVRQSNGQTPHPEAQNNEELKILAIQGLMNNDSERAIPLLEKVLTGSASPKEKSKALFVLAQSGSPKAREVLANIARGQGNPELQRKAIEYLGLFGGGVRGGIHGGVSGGIKGGVGGTQSSGDTLANIYASTTDASVKRAILKSYMLSGDREHLFAAAKNEKNDELKRDAIRQLGLTGAQNELAQLYAMDISVEIREELLQAFFLAGDATRLATVAQSDKNPEIRRTAIRDLGLVNSPEGNKALLAIYAKETGRGLREDVLNALFIEGNAADLVTIARGEKDIELKKAAVQKLSLMDSKEATNCMMELLQK